MNNSSTLPEYAELHALSNFSFQQSASHPQELVAQASVLGYRAIAITDECSMAGVVRAWEAAREHDIALIVGSLFHLQDGPTLIALACNHQGYSNICSLITKARRAASKGSYRLEKTDMQGGLEGCIWLLKARPDQDLKADIAWAVMHLPNVALGITLLNTGEDQRLLQQHQELARRFGIPLLACGDVRMHVRARRALLDVQYAVHHHVSVAQLGYRATPNGEQHLRRRETLAQRYPKALLANTVAAARDCRFSLDQLSYTYPREIVPPGSTLTRHLHDLTMAGIKTRWPDGVDDAVHKQIHHELDLIAQMQYEAFFLTVYDVVAFARAQGILCQGRGSAANSAVCYCLGITEVNPAHQNLLFERFISRERNEPPDIDVDFEHERREEVIQYIYRKYGRDRAALAATVISYRPKSAFREVGKALGLDADKIDQLSQSLSWWESGGDVLKTRLAEIGLDPDARLTRQYLALVEQILGFPRHLSQHVGGFVIADQPLHSLVPIENAAMPERTIIQWDKDDLESLGLLKVDCLALGMLTAVRKAFGLIDQHYDQQWTMDTILRDQANDPATYAMLHKADTVGVFQIESRAQMTMLPRLKPRNFYDLVIEIALVRPGPIQGNMVHPYLARRQDPDAVSYPSPELKTVLERTLGVPIFQEQVMQIAMVAGGFSAGEADQLRRAMAAWKRRGGLEPFQDRLRQGMLQRGYDETFADQIFDQIKGFADYGFPESHSASFALLAYVSSWLKCHYPAAFACAVLNSQPMGFYAPAQLIADVRRHAVSVLPVDVRYSDWDYTLEEKDGDQAIRVGMRSIKGLAQACAKRIVQARAEAGFTSMADLRRRGRCDRKALQALAGADALKGISGNRHQAGWQVAAAVNEPLQQDLVAAPAEENVNLPAPSKRDTLLQDYAATGFSLRSHPVNLVRPKIRHRTHLAKDLGRMPNGAMVTVLGVVTHRQRPQTASGVVFLGLEDETGAINVVCWPKLQERFRSEILQGSLLQIRGELQIEQSVVHVIARHLKDVSDCLDDVSLSSRDFH